MKKLFFPILALALVIFSTCEKREFDEHKGEYGEFELCESNDFEDPDNLNIDNLEKYIVKPLVVDESCGCVVSGLIKYVKDNKTVALIDYGKGECDEWAVKTLYDEDGNCNGKSKNSYCKFKIECEEPSNEINQPKSN